MARRFRPALRRFGLRSPAPAAILGPMRKPIPLVATIVAAAFCIASESAADVSHPYILWTPEEAAVLRKTFEREPWARESLERLAARPRSEPFVNLFRYQVLGDEKAGQAERKYLLSFVGAPLERRDSTGRGVGRHYDNYLHAIRYDALYDSLTPEQRRGLEETFRRFIRYELDHPYRNTRLSLLPNMQLPRLVAAHLMSVALGEEALIRRLWAAPSGFRWFFDEYLSDGGFYNEEFGKMTSLIGEYLLYCRGLERLGLNELGYGFEGRGGATMRRYVESYIWLGYPRTELPGGLPRYERVAMGDTRGRLLGVFQHANVPGFLGPRPDGVEPGGKRGRSLLDGWDDFYAANMNGRDHRGTKTQKLQFPQWFEVLHARYPDGPFGYFLVAMRRPGRAKYVPTPFWGLAPLGADDVEPPPAPSAVYPERGFAMLRAEESPAYWSSPAPAVALQFATLYVHYTSDCFSLLGYHAFNRPIYLNRAISAGYNGGPWDFSVRGHCGVVVDAEQAQPIGTVPSREDFSPVVKFVSARGVLAEGAELYQGVREVRSSDQPRAPATDVYTNVDLSRSLFLAREYLFDVYWLADREARPRRFYWLVHPPGVLESTEGWTPSTDLQATLFNVKALRDERGPRRRSLPPADAPSESWVRIQGERKMALGEGPADVTVVQRCILPDAGRSVLGPEWYAREVGVRVRMLGVAGTNAYVFDTPTCYPPGTLRSPRGGEAPPRPETGGVSIVVAREAPRTIFAALHEPIEGGRSGIERFERIAQVRDAVAARIVGREAGVNDRVMVRIGDSSGEPLTLEGGGERFTFAGHAFVRIGPDRVEARGDLRELRVKVEGRPQLVVNGRDRPARIADGFLAYAAH